MMYLIALFLHSLLRWAILFVGIAIVGKSLMAANKDKAYEKLDSTLSLVMMILCDLMLIIGFYQWSVGHTMEIAKMQDMGANMKDPVIRFFLVEHFLMMLVAIILIHVGRILVKKKENDLDKHKTTWKFFAISIIIMIISIPWPFRQVGEGRGWLRFL